MVRCDGEDSEAVRPFLTSRLKPQGAESLFLYFPEGVDTTTALWTPRILKMTRNGATRLMPGPWTPGLSSPSSSDSRTWCTWNHHTTRLRNRLQKVKPKDGDQLPRQHPPRRDTTFAAAPANAGDHRQHAPITTELPPPLLLQTFLIFPFLPSLFCPVLSGLKPPGLCFPHPQIQFALLSRLHWLGSRTRP